MCDGLEDITHVVAHVLCVLVFFVIWPSYMPKGLPKVVG